MPARSSFVPKYCLHRPSGRAYVRIRGKVIYVGDYGSAASKAEYGRLVAELAVSPASLPPSPVSQLTVVELADAYLAHADGYYRKEGQPTRSIEEVRSAIRILNALYGHTPVAEFGPLSLLAIQSTLASKNRARTYVNKLVGYIKRIFKWGVSRQLVPPQVHIALTTIEGLRKGRTSAREPSPVMPVEDDVVDGTLPFLPVVVGDMVKIQRLSGCRPGEVCQLRPCDVDCSGDVWSYRPASHKTDYRGRERIIFLGPKAQAVLLPYLLRDSESHCFSPADSVAKHQRQLRQRRKTRVQPSQRSRRRSRPQKAPGDRYTRHAYCQAITRAIHNANRQRTKEAAEKCVEPMLLPRWHANQLRHSKATEIRRQFGLEAAQVSLGHAKADVTQIYAERDSKLAIEVARKIG